MQRKTLSVFLVLALLAFGFAQEFIKVATNHYLEVGDQVPGFYDLDKEARSKEMHAFGKKMSYTSANYEGIAFFHGMSRKSIALSKWAMTAVFVIIHCIGVVWIIRWWFATHEYSKPIVLLYVLVIAMVVVVMGAGKLTGVTEASYGLARKLLGALQSTVPLMLIFPACLLHQNKSLSNDET